MITLKDTEFLKVADGIQRAFLASICSTPNSDSYFDLLDKADHFGIRGITYGLLRSSNHSRPRYGLKIFVADTPPDFLPNRFHGIDVEHVRVSPFRVSSGPGDSIIGQHSGTLGCIGTRANHGGQYLLSNAHVLVGYDPPPGVLTVSDVASRVQIAIVEDSTPWDSMATNHIDAAVAKLTIQGATTAMIYGPLSQGSTPAGMPMSVKKQSSRGVTHGTIHSLTGAFSMLEAGTLYKFASQIFVSGNNNGEFSADGDSGSLCVTDDANNSPVGLLFAVCDVEDEDEAVKSYSVMCPIQPVFDKFAFTVA
jgi:hypothetical protein